MEFSWWMVMVPAAIPIASFTFSIPRKRRERERRALLQFVATQEGFVFSPVVEWDDLMPRLMTEAISEPPSDKPTRFFPSLTDQRPSPRSKVRMRDAISGEVNGFRFRSCEVAYVTGTDFFDDGGQAHSYGWERVVVVDLGRVGPFPWTQLLDQSQPRRWVTDRAVTVRVDMEAQVLGRMLALWRIYEFRAPSCNRVIRTRNVEFAKEVMKRVGDNELRSAGLAAIEISSHWLVANVTGVGPQDFIAAVRAASDVAARLCELPSVNVPLNEYDCWVATKEVIDEVAANGTRFKPLENIVRIEI